jgi:hypothetical protein
MEAVRALEEDLFVWKSLFELLPKLEMQLNGQDLIKNREALIAKLKKTQETPIKITSP